MMLRQLLVRTVSVIALGLAASPASAQLVTYSWTTTSQGFGTNVSQPTSASFQVALSAVQSGRINVGDITNIQLAYPGLFFDAYTASSGGLDNATFVNPVTGALVYQSPDQGLAVIGYQGGLFSDSFLSITVGNRYSPFGAPLTSVADQFNALKNGGPFAGFPTAGYWTAELPEITGGVPEPATWAMLILGFGLIGGAVRANRQSQKVTVSYS
jgi:PEP-CTERM motif